MIIENDTLVLRPPAMTDARELLAGEDDEIGRWFEFVQASRLEDVERAIRTWTESWEQSGAERCWVICDRATGAIAGGVELRRLDEPTEVNLSYWIFPAWRGKRIATRAAELALGYAATEMNASRAVLKVLYGNEASIAVAKHLHAELVGEAESDSGGTFLVFHRELRAP